MARYTSPPGTFERIYKWVLEDPTLTNAEFRLVCYLAGKPPGWVISAGQLAAALERSEYEIATALRGLRKRKLVITTDERGERGRVTGRVSRLDRSAVVAPNAQVSTHMPDSAIVDATCGNAESSQVSTQMVDYLAQEIRPPREDCLVVSTEVSRSPGRPDADAPGAHDGQDQDQDQDHQRRDEPTARTAELIIFARLAVTFGCYVAGEDDRPSRFRALVRWQQRTIPSEHHRTAMVEEVTRYLLRCYRAAPDQMLDLAGLKHDDYGPEFAEQAGLLLAEVRAAAKPYELERAHEDWCDRLTGKALAEAADGLLADDGSTVPLDDAAAIETGASWARYDQRK
jgi:hypothetical protein